MDVMDEAFVAWIASILKTVVLRSVALLQKRAWIVLPQTLLSRGCIEDTVIMMLRKGDNQDVSESIRELSWTSHKLIPFIDGIPRLSVFPPVFSPCMLKISSPHCLSASDCLHPGLWLCISFFSGVMRDVLLAASFGFCEENKSLRLYCFAPPLNLCRESKAVVLGGLV